MLSCEERTRPQTARAAPFPQRGARAPYAHTAALQGLRPRPATRTAARRRGCSAATAESPPGGSGAGRGGGAGPGPGGACADRDQSAAPASRARSILRAGAVPRRLRTGCRIPPQRGPWRRSPASTPASVSGAGPRGGPHSAVLSPGAGPCPPPPDPPTAAPAEVAAPGRSGPRRGEDAEGSGGGPAPVPSAVCAAPGPAFVRASPGAAGLRRRHRRPSWAGGAARGGVGPLSHTPPPSSVPRGRGGPRGWRRSGSGGAPRHHPPERPRWPRSGAGLGAERRLAPIRWVPAALKSPIAAPSVLQHHRPSLGTVGPIATARLPRLL